MAYSTSVAYKAAVAQNARTWRLNISMYLDSGQELNLTENDVTQGTFVFEEASTCSDLIDIGSTYANSLNFSIKNPDGRFNDISFAYARLTARAGLLTGMQADGTLVWEDIPLGEFFVQDDGKRMSTIPLKCLDRMAKLNGLFSDIPLLADDTPANMMAKIADKYIFNIENDPQKPITTQDLIDTLTIPLEPSVLPKKMTCRDFIGYCAAVFGKNARFNRDGQLEFYFNCPATETTVDPVITTPDTRLTDMSFSDRAIQITGVTVRNSYDEAVQKGEDWYTVSMDANPILTDPDLTNDALNMIYDALCVPYAGYQTGIIGDPSIQAGDPVRHMGLPGFSAGAGLNSVVTKHRFKFRGNGSLEAAGEPAESNRQLTNTNKKILESQRKAKEDLNLAVNGMAKAIAKQSELITNSLGFYTDYEIDAETGALTHFWIMDKPKDQSPTIIWRFTENGWQVSNDGGGSWNSGWDAGGNIITNSVTSNLIQTEAIKALDNLLSVDLTNGQLKTITETGITEILGHEMNMSCYDQDLQAISNLKISADMVADDYTADMQICFGDKDNNTLSSISQMFTFDPEDGHPVSVDRLTTSDLRVQSRLEVTDAMEFDKIIMQRKSAEVGNTGVDFVVMED